MAASSLLAGLLLLAACTTPTATPVGGGQAPAATKAQVEGGSYFEVGPAALAAMLKNKDFLFVNVHVPYEGEIEPTDLFIPYDQISAHLDQLPKDKGAKVFLYCRSGNMSAIAAKELVKLGYSNVWNLAGGMIGWKAAGYPVAEKR
ncbi:MAG: rhodanese-like domain-containing protein [Chloroflexi bacterium]|nr:rhodanese-like domain-containing protein [Chloroflexota bacterium]